MGIGLMHLRRGILLNTPHIETASGNIATFETDMVAPLKECVINIEPVQSGSGDPSPDNVRPITGWTELNAWNDPEHGGLVNWNQLASLEPSYWTTYRMSVSVSGTKITGTVTSTSTATIKTFGKAVAKNHKFFVKGIKCKENTIATAIGMYSNSNGNTYSGRSSFLVSDTDDPFNLFLASDDTYYYLRVTASTNAISTNNDLFAIENFQIFDLTEMFGSGNEPATSEEFTTLFYKNYYAYNVGEQTIVSAVNGDPYRSINVEFPVDADTVYGGTLSLNRDGSGTLAAEYVSRTFGRGTSISAVSKNGYARIRLGDYGYIVNGVGISNMFKKFSGSASSMPAGYFNCINSSGYNQSQLNIRCDFESSTITEQDNKYIAFINDMDDAGTPLQVVYKLATPTIYTIPASDMPSVIKTLKGTNNIWADTGSIASVKFWTH